MQREETPTMETGLERIAAEVTATKAVSSLWEVSCPRGAVNQLLKSVVRYVAFAIMWRPAENDSEMGQRDAT